MTHNSYKVLFIVIAILFSNKIYAKGFDIEQYQEYRAFPETSFLDLDTNQHLLEEFEGSGLLVVFWASWCDICHNELPDLDLLQKKFIKKPLKIIALSEDFKGTEQVKEFYLQHNISYLDAYLDQKNTIFNQLNVTSLPTAFLVNKDGNITAKLTGPINWQADEINQLLTDLIKDATHNYNKKPSKKQPEKPKNNFEVPEEAVTYIGVNNV